MRTTFTDRVRTCVALADLAYQDNVTLEDIAPLGLLWVKQITVGDASALIAGHDIAEVYVAFRGTDSIWDVMADARFIKTGFPRGGRVHKGFMSHFDKIWPEVRAFLDGFEDPPEVLIYTGHSLGGAMCQLAAAMHSGTEAVTFGCPRVGNDEFCRLAAKTPGTHFEARHDPVTGLPLRWGPVQALTALFRFRKPTMFRQPWNVVDVDSKGHSMDGYLNAVRGKTKHSSAKPPLTKLAENA